MEDNTSLSDEMGFEMKDDFQELTDENQENVEQGEEGNQEEKADETKNEDSAVEPNAEEENKEEGSENEEAKEEEKDNGEESAETESKEEEKAEESEPEVEQEQPDTSSLIKNEILEATQGEFESVKELQDAYKDLLEETSGKDLLEFFNEAAEDTYGEGVTFADVVEYKSRDFDSWSNIDLIKENLYREDPGITDAEIAAELREFDLLNKSETEIAELIEDEVISQANVDDLQAKLLRKGRAAKNDLKAYQDSLDIDNLMVSTPKQTTQEEQPQGPTEEEVKAKQEALNKSINDFSEIQVEVGTKDDSSQVKFEISDEDRNGIRDFLTGESEGKQRNWLDKRWMNDDGTINNGKLSQDVYKILNYDRDVKIGYTQGKAAGVKEEVKETDNINMKKDSGTQTKDEGGLDQAAQIAAEIN
jgi:hypothetical protein